MTLRLGTPDVKPDTSSHVPGLPMGNSKGHYDRQKGHRPGGKSTAERSTGIEAKRRNPILPGMPNLSPP